MVNRNLIRNLDDDTIASELAVMAPEEQADEWLLEWLEQDQQDYAQGEIVDGRIVEVNDEWALVDVGFKSEGTVNLNEWGPDEEKPKAGDTVKVLIEEMEDELGAADDPYGMISLSKDKAKKILEWERIIANINEGQVVTGTVIRKIKGGLLVDIGVNVFLPGSQVDIRRPGDIGDFIGRVIQAEVLKIDDTRRNIVISRRSLIERQREEDPGLPDEGTGSRADPQGDRQKHRRLRCLRRPWRHRRSSAHHRHGLGTDRTSHRNGLDRPGNRGQGAAYRPREAKDRSRSETKGPKPVGEHRDQVPPSVPTTRARSST